MTPSLPHHTGGYRYLPGSVPQHTIDGQTIDGQPANNGPNPAEAGKNERINIVRTIQTQGLKPDQQHYLSQQPLTHPLQHDRIRADSTTPPYFNQLPKQYPLPTVAPTLNWAPVSANNPALRHQFANQHTGVHPTAGSKPYIPLQAHHISRVSSTNTFPHPSKVPVQQSQASVKSLADLQTETDMFSFLLEMSEGQTVAPPNQVVRTGPALSSCQPAGSSARHAIDPGTRLSGTAGPAAPLPFSQSSCHRPANKHPDYSVISADGMGYRHPSLAPAWRKSQSSVQPSQLKRPHNPDWNHNAKMRAFQSLNPSLDTVNRQRDQATYSSGPANRHQYPVSQQGAPEPVAQPRETPQTANPVAGSSHSDHKQMTQPAPTNPVDFHWQAPEFNRKSKEIMSLIRETQRILGIQSLNLPWITPAHVFIIAADAIDGNVTETTMQILRSGYLKSLPNGPENPLENVNQEMASVVSNWYEQSEENRIETEYLELLNSINKYRQAKGKLKFRKRASYGRILNSAAEILKSEREINGSNHLPPKRKRAYLFQYIETALKFIQSSSGSMTDITSKEKAAGSNE